MAKVWWMLWVCLGLKVQLKRLLWEDFSYRKVLGIQEYLIEKFRDDPCKKYFLVDLAQINNHRSKTSMKIKGCWKQHMISYCPDGTVQTKINVCSCEYCLRGRFFDCLDENGVYIPYSNHESANETDSNTDESDNDFDSNDEEERERWSNKII